MINRILKILFFALIIKPIMFIILGLNIANRKALAEQGPALLATNHNSHLDTMVLMSLYPLSMIHKVRPVAAADYFLKHKALAWFSLNIIGIIPLERKNAKDFDRFFNDCINALDNDDILIFFPEGSRGKPEQLSPPKKGLYYLRHKRPDTPVIPVVMHGLGRALPRGEALFVPFNCDIIVGEPLSITNNSDELVENLLNIYDSLLSQCITRND